MPITDHEQVCDTFSGFRLPGFRLRLTVAATDPEAYSAASDMIAADRERIAKILGTAFARAVRIIRAGQPVPARRAQDINTRGASAQQNP